MKVTVLRIVWCDMIVLSVYALTKDKSNVSKEMSCKEP